MTRKTYMNPLMSAKIAALRKSPLTFFTFVRFLPSVTPNMNLQSARSHELIATCVANVRSLPRVSSLVVSQVPLRCETHVAISEIALVGLRSVMNSHMCE